MKLKNLFFLVLLSVLATSCVFTEEINLTKSGSGNYSFKIDMSEMMKSMGGLSPKDSLATPEKLDTIIYFKDILEERKDSIKQLTKEEQELLYSLEEFKIRMNMDEETNKMIMDFNLDFKNLQELADMEKKVSKIQALNDKKQEESIPSKADVTYEMKGNTFHRKVTLKKLSEEEEKEFNNSIEQSSSFLEGSLYKVIYHFENEIKNVSFEGAQISPNKRTLTIEIPMDSVLKNPRLLDFEVLLK